jgi:serine/threonine protein kinase
MPDWQVPGYTELTRLGSGSFGTVMLARHDATGLLVAIKYLRPDLLADEEAAARFRREAQVLASLHDQNVVRLYEFVESASGAAIVMELVDGVTLRAILARNGTTTPEAALVVLQGSLLGLAAAHWHGVVHGDYRAENVLVNGEGVSKLTDFGIAALASSRPGTSPYAAPEQLAGAPASPASDVYSATATFYECLAGRPPFTGDSEPMLRQHRAEPVSLEPVPEPLRPLVTAGMTADPERRPADGMVFVTELRAAAAGAYGQDWEERGQSHLGEAVVLLAALWPSRQAPAVQGTATERIPLIPQGLRQRLRQIGVRRAAIAIVVVAVLIAAGVALATNGSQQPGAAPTPPIVTVPPVTLGTTPASRSSSPRPSPSPADAPPPAASASPPPSFPPVSPSPVSADSPSSVPSPPASQLLSPSPASSSSPDCQPAGTGCVKSGSYPGPGTVINASFGGSYTVVWTGSTVAAGTASWTADITYTNVTSSALALNCQGDWTQASYVTETLSGGGTFAASSTSCSQEPSLSVQLPAGGSYTLTATFPDVPPPGGDVAITWGNAGTSTSVDPFGS